MLLYSGAPQMQQQQQPQQQQQHQQAYGGYPGYGAAAAVVNPYGASALQQQQQQQSAYGQAPVAVVKSALPSAWTEHKTDDGIPYWHNATTGVSQVSNGSSPLLLLLV